MATLLIVLFLCTPVFKWIGVGIGYIVGFPVVLIMLGLKGLLHRGTAKYVAQTGGVK